MVRSVRFPVAPEQVAEPVAGPLQRVQGLAGVAVCALVATRLGLPLAGGYLAIDLLLVVLGYQMAQTLRQGQYQERHLLRFWMGIMGRIGVPMAVALTLTVGYASFAGELAEPQRDAVVGAITMTLNLFLLFGSADFAAIEHLWLVALLVQFSVVVPIAVFAGRKRFTATHRAAALLGLGVAIGSLRMVLLLAGAGVEAVGIHPLTRVDGLLIGAAIAIAPHATLRKRIPPDLAAPAFACLLLLFVTAPAPQSFHGIIYGLLTGFAVVLSAGLIAAASGAGLTGALSIIVDNHATRWLGARAISIFVWHQLFGFAFSSGGLMPEIGSNESIGDWPGLAIFLLRVIFTLAAASTSHRFLEIPLTVIVKQLVDQRSSEKAAVEPAPDTDWELEPAPASDPEIYFDFNPNETAGLRH